ncbi:glutaminase [Tsukamurella pseudospumae]|uniref:Glutaminase n=1 Tax=Tsukamurella pseudospumae TaxID=239498 RepID=A0A138A144_9ACTN|nr:glutaminase [Tsukamurella pseudospumae]KXP04152.1 glutaminase [Tsukamurella pseudospumae]
MNAALARVLDDVRRSDPPGAVADYIPQLAHVDPDRFGIATVSVAGHSYGAGDHRTPFTIQSISKPFVYALALQTLGIEAVGERIGVEPSGEAFNGISFDAQGRPENPLINAGAIVCTSLIPAADGAERFAAIRAGLSRFAGRELELDDAVYLSEAATGFRNLALAALARSTDALRTTVEDALDPYFRQCSLLVDAHDVAVMGATLASGGVNPVTGERVISEPVARQVLSVMAGCGMYDRSGAWLCTVGIPAKSGVGGGIVAASPGEYGIGVFSPPLDDAGNSSRGVAALQQLSDEFGLHMLSRPLTAVTALAGIDVDPASGRVTLRLRGEVDFVATEQLVHEILSTGQVRIGTAVTVDLTNATRLAPVARYLLTQMQHDLGYGVRVEILDPSGLLG